ncbi:MAG: hypothetical protein WCH60_17280 [Burkholderiales bacterium]
MVLSSISWMSARRPNGGKVLKNVESQSPHLPDGFRRPADQWSRTPAPHATTDVRHLPKVLPASASALASSVFLKNETCDPSHLCISATMGLVMPARLKGGNGHP